MMTKVKERNRIISGIMGIILIIALVFSSTALLNRVDAKSVSEADAVAWMNSVKGKTLDYDGAYGGQCVDFFNYYLRDVY